MADDLGDEWWKNQPAGAASNSASDGEGGQDAKMMPQEIAPVPVLSKKAKQPKECFLIQPRETQEDATKTRKRRKKKITDILAKSEPQPGTPEDLQKLMKDYYSSSRSVIELEELNLPDSCFLKANDLTHSLSSYLKEICPKWAKLCKNHSEKKSVLMLIICSSAIRALELIRSMTAFRGNGKVIKLFAKHIKIQEQVKMLDKRVVHLGVGTPGRIKELIKQGGLNLNPLKFLVFDWNWRDQKLRRMMDIPEIRKEVFELLEIGVLGLCKSESLKLGLF
ncbi:protein CMSS1 isoform X2 [Talpa occidentalis]|uniref:protein CMSS1 isoform X2 n=1 Tax=Talpa occidentalis TaxID=50954 RepID=UPI0023F67ED4|nr:protein CMSS1 isoform X2 [Talpa occidentalis]